MSSRQTASFRSVSVDLAEMSSDEENKSGSGYPRGTAFRELYQRPRWNVPQESYQHGRGSIRYSGNVRPFIPEDFRNNPDYVSPDDFVRRISGEPRNEGPGIMPERFVNPLFEGSSAPGTSPERSVRSMSDRESNRRRPRRSAISAEESRRNTPPPGQRRTFVGEPSENGPAIHRLARFVNEDGVGIERQADIPVGIAEGRVEEIHGPEAVAEDSPVSAENDVFADAVTVPNQVVETLVDVPIGTTEEGIEEVPSASESFGKQAGWGEADLPGGIYGTGTDELTLDQIERRCFGNGPVDGSYARQKSQSTSCKNVPEGRPTLAESGRDKERRTSSQKGRTPSPSTGGDGGRRNPNLKREQVPDIPRGELTAEELRENLRIAEEWADRERKKYQQGVREMGRVERRQSLRTEREDREAIEERAQQGDTRLSTPQGEVPDNGGSGEYIHYLPEGEWFRWPKGTPAPTPWGTFGPMEEKPDVPKKWKKFEGERARLCRRTEEQVAQESVDRKAREKKMMETYHFRVAKKKMG
eukprot:GHVU01034299.1.p1 GENE.GHVU01034299.1~~GHVU01034299.1.p1  ORF type:complete len:529 (+),score=61.18 GHVU01034299.1:340-1926(+)